MGAGVHQALRGLPRVATGQKRALLGVGLLVLGLSAGGCVEKRSSEQEAFVEKQKALSRELVETQRKELEAREKAEQEALRARERAETEQERKERERSELLACCELIARRGFEERSTVDMGAKKLCLESASADETLGSVRDKLRSVLADRPLPKGCE